MKERKNNIVLLVCLIVVFVIVVSLIMYDLFSNDNYSLLLINDENISDLDVNEYDKEDIELNNDYFTEDKKEENIIIDNSEKNNLSNYEDNEDNNQNVVSKEENMSEDYDVAEEDVVNYFQNMELEIENSGSFKEKFKQYFITIVDFIFYDEEIKGYTFDELSDIAKIKIISFALKIDNKIEEYIPGYKETISATSNRVYSDIKEKLVMSYMDISTLICKDNEVSCNEVKEIFGEIKDVCKIGWSFIKNIVSNSAIKVREWYEIYSGK